MSLLVVTILVVCSSYTVLGQLSCDPGIFSPAGAVCRRIEKRDEACKDLIKCLDNCFWKGVRIVDSTSGCKRCGTTSNSNSISNVNVTYKFVPYKFYRFKLFVQLPAVSEVKYELELKLPFKRPVCVCTNESFSFIVDYWLNDFGPMVLKVKSFSTEIFARKIPLPRHCGDTERGVPYDDNTCGMPQLQPPANVTMRCNETHTNISWNQYIRPDNSHSLIKSEKFYITVQYSDNTELEFVVFNASSVTLNTTAAMDITLYGYTRCSGLLELGLGKTSATGYSLPVHTSNIGPGTCCGNSTCDATSSIIHPHYTPQPSRSLHPNSNNVQPKTVRGQSVKFTGSVIAALFFAILIALLTVIISIIIFILFFQKKRNLAVSGCPPHISALIVYSPNTPEKEKLAIMQNFQNLKSETELFLQDTRSPQQSLSDWISEHHKSASTVFCVCNEEFERDWENKSGDSVAAMHTLKMLFQGDFSSKKYVVVLVKSADKVFIPACLKGLPRINITDTPALAKFAE